MSIFPPPEHHRHLNFIVVLEKPDRLLDFEINIMLTGFGTEPDFLQFGLMLFALGLSFGLVVFEFSEIHNSTDRGFGGGGDFHQIQVGLFGFFECLTGG